MNWNLEQIKLQNDAFAREVIQFVATVSRQTAVDYVDWHGISNGIDDDLWRDSEEYCEAVIDRIRDLCREPYL